MGTKTELEDRLFPAILDDDSLFPLSRKVQAAISRSPQRRKRHRDRPDVLPADPLLGSLNLTPEGTSGEQFQSEISASVKVSGKLFLLSSGGGNTLQVVDATNPANAILKARVSLEGYTSQSVAAFDHWVAVALSPEDYRDSPAKGRVRFYRLSKNGTLKLIQEVEVGYLPDGIAFNEKGTQLVVANEGEPNRDYSLDPIGSIGIIDIKGRTGRERFSYTELSFEGVTLPEGLRISGPAGTSPAEDIEPEYVSIRGQYAYVTLQENNGVAKVNLATKRIQQVFALGSVDFSQQLLDLTDRDNGIKPKLGQPYAGLRMPDGIAAYRVKGKEYFITANEGDGREYGDYTDEERRDRLKTLAEDSTPPYTAFGSRSITIFDAQSGSPLWDSGNTLQTLAIAAGVYDDGRSDDKGVEPEGVVVAQVGRRSYAIVGMERTTRSMLAVFDVTDPAATHLVTSTILDGSLSPEGLLVIDAKESSTGRSTLVVSNEVSNTLNFIDLEALIASDPVAGAGTFSQTMLKDVEGGSSLTLSSLLTTGEFTNGLTPGSSVYTAPGILDGMGAFRNEEGTYTLLVNSELRAALGYEYSVEGFDGPVTGARISKFIVDIDEDDNAANGYQSRILRGGLAYDKVISRDTNGFDRFCSAVLVEAHSFGSGRGFADRIYLTGEETDQGPGGAVYALDVATDDLYEVAGFGRAGFENITLIDTGNVNTVAALLLDDSTAPLYLWVGEKTAGGFLERNGLAADQGTLYAWKPPETLDLSYGEPKPDTADLNALDLSTPIAGSWVALGSGTEVAALSAVDLRQRAFDHGALELIRLEDGAINPLNGQQVVFNTTGGSGDDLYGGVYTLDFSSAFAANGKLATTGATTLKVIYDGDRLGDPTDGIRSPDNLAWSADGLIYIQEDRSAPFGTQEASIWKLDPNHFEPLTGQAVTERWAQIDRSAVPIDYGQTDPVPLDIGNWESSGIIDVSSLYGTVAGSYFLADVQAHSLKDGNLNGSSYLVEGGQINLIHQNTGI
ncbi:choice-of-anchor I domain-containing protein [Lyngbya confervoides]|uniref:PhoX family protein n=1 Tax=Lyngbya confervoides BDU141951 TaxID=1574623 RepID=A0ABD4T4T5_9CYAN|nr:alkaline phosphatase PhoX [Lyngbya confervoides]MCM1983247.1 PhoX family protein [Lyngbya confervoides BDU141951]